MSCPRPRPLRCAAFTLALVAAALPLFAEPPAPTRQPVRRAVDLKIGEQAQVALADGSMATVKLLELRETTDTMSLAVRSAEVSLEVNGLPCLLSSGNYNLPKTVGGVRIDCPITRGYNANSTEDSWALEKDARLRLWPAGSPLIEPETFGYPVKQRWFATMTQFTNEPTYVDGGDTPARQKIYYHNDLDFGGCEGLVGVVAATDALVVSARKMTLPGYENTPVRPRYDVLYLLDDRGWYYRYSHFESIADDVVPGAQVKRGQKLGILGKEGGSGGWTHLHFGIKAMQPSGRYGTEEAYGFTWEAYLREQRPKIIAVARPHHFVRVGEALTLDGSKSWSATGPMAKYEWTFSDGSKASGPQVRRTYTQPGSYSEILKATDAAGHYAYDFAVVQVIGGAQAELVPPAIHPSFAPTMDVHAGPPVTFKVRTFRDAGGETWDFGDGTEKVHVKSDGNAVMLAKEGYAVTQHAFAKPGDYIVQVEHTNARGERAVAHLWVVVK